MFVRTTRSAFYFSIIKKNNLRNLAQLLPVRRAARPLKTTLKAAQMAGTLQPARECASAQGVPGYSPHLERTFLVAVLYVSILKAFLNLINTPPFHPQHDNDVAKEKKNAVAIPKETTVQHCYHSLFSNRILTCTLIFLTFLLSFFIYIFFY